MTEALRRYVDSIKHKKIAVLGLGLSNLALLRFLKEIGAAHITVFDRNDSAHAAAQVQRLLEEGSVSAYHLGEDYLNNIAEERWDVIFKTPVIRPDLPQLLAAQDAGAEVTSEMEVFMRYCPARIYGITGSDGKTTTTTVLHKLLSAEGGTVYLGGNIGTPLIDRLTKIREQDRVVVELSSFQLMHMHVSPDVSVITNITPNHLDVHKNYEEYIEAKEQIFCHQRPEGIVVLNCGNDQTRRICHRLLQHGGHIVRCFSGAVPFPEVPGQTDGCAFIENGSLVYQGKTEFRLPLQDILLPGMHNVENYMAAVCACADTLKAQTLQEVARTFGGVAHRMEFVRELNGVKYYNSSIDSSPNRTIHALSVFSRRVVLIAGGKDKNIPYDALGPVLLDRVRVLILTGPTAEKIEAALKAAAAQRGISDPDVTVIRCEDYSQAVAAAYHAAVPGEAVVLSPASTSFDQFKNFEERGRCYKDLVQAL